MSIDMFRRRVALPEPPQGEIMLQAPPALPRGSGQGGMQMMFMLPMMLGMGAMSFVYIGRSGGAMTWVFGALYISVMVGMLIMAVSRGGASKKAQINDERRDYLRYLGGLRGQVREVAVRQREAALAALPEPADLWSYAGTDRLWERGRTDPDFGRVRVGVGPQRLATALRAPQTAPLEDLDPVASTSLRHFIRTYATVADLPVAVSLRSFRRITLAGDRPIGLHLVRAMLAHLVTFHSPDDLRIAVCVAPDRQDTWDWLKWLPHAMHPGRTDPSGPTRLAAPTLAGLAALLADDPAEPGTRGTFRPGARPDAPHLLILVDGGPPTPTRGWSQPVGWPAPPCWRSAAHRATVRASSTWSSPRGTSACVRPTGWPWSVNPTSSAWPVPRWSPGSSPRCTPDHPSAPTSPSPAPSASPTCSVSATLGTSTPPSPGAPAPPATGCASRSAWTQTAARSTSTSRSPPRAAWVHTGWSSGRRLRQE